jgi:hypothetical protein
MEETVSVRVGDRVSFSMSDVFLPEPSEVLANLTLDVRVEGLVENFSDSGSILRAYAMVRIGPEQMIVLPTSALQVLPQP